MRTVTHREMRNKSGEILRSVADGQSIQVTNRGQVAAVISPADGDLLARLLAQGHVRPARRPVEDLSTVRRRRARSTSEQILADSRGSW